MNTSQEGQNDQLHEDPEDEVVCSQLDPEGWSLALDVKALGQSIKGRNVSNSLVLHVSGEDMRKYYSKKP